MAARMCSHVPQGGLGPVPDMADNDLILAGLTDVKGEMHRVRDSVHSLRNEVTSKVSALELAHVEAKGQVAVLQNQMAAFKEKIDGYDRGIDRRFKEHEERLDVKIDALKTSLEGSIAAAKDSLSELKTGARNWLAWVVVPLGFFVLQVLGKRLHWL